MHKTRYDACCSVEKGGDFVVVWQSAGVNADWHAVRLGSAADATSFAAFLVQGSDVIASTVETLERPCQRPAGVFHATPPGAFSATYQHPVFRKPK